MIDKNISYLSSEKLGLVNVLVRIMQHYHHMKESAEKSARIAAKLAAEMAATQVVAATDTSTTPTAVRKASTIPFEYAEQYTMILNILWELINFNHNVLYLCSEKLQLLKLLVYIATHTTVQYDKIKTLRSLWQLVTFVIDNHNNVIGENKVEILTENNENIENNSTTNDNSKENEESKADMHTTHTLQQETINKINRSNTSIAQSTQDTHTALQHISSQSLGLVALLMDIIHHNDNTSGSAITSAFNTLIAVVSTAL